jgi:hypothetical protein
MARQIIQTVRTPLFDNNGRLRVYQIDTYTVEHLEPTQAQVQTAPAPAPQRGR